MVLKTASSWTSRLSRQLRLLRRFPSVSGRRDEPCMTRISTSLCFFKCWSLCVPHRPALREDMRVVHRNTNVPLAGLFMVAGNGYTSTSFMGIAFYGLNAWLGSESVGGAYIIIECMKGIQRSLIDSTHLRHPPGSKGDGTVVDGDYYIVCLHHSYERDF